MNRREFIKYGSLGIGALGVLGPSAFAAETNPATATAIGRKRVVVVGGGFAGATAAKYCRLADPTVEVILIEPNERFISCPISNWVIGGLREMKDITLGYQKLVAHGVRVIPSRVTGIDPVSRYVETAEGKIGYDRLIVAPGISFRYDTIEGLDERARRMMPHAYKAGPQTIQLRQELVAMKPGGTVIVTVPDGYYRCPPGPYERVSLIANYLKKNKGGSKIIVLDPHPDIASKGALFHKAWNDYYSDIIDYRPESILAKVDADRKSVSTYEQEFQGDVINLIPDQKAGDLAFTMGLVPKGQLWAPVDPVTFESTVVPGVHVIGDATDPATSGPMPKSGFVANSMGKVAAAAVVALLNDKNPPKPTYANSCYSLVSDTEGIYITGVYTFDEASKKTVAIKEASKASPDRSPLYARHAADWASSIWTDMLG